MDRATTDPSRQPPPPDILLAIPLSVSVPNPSQAPAVSPGDVRDELESGQRQAPEEVPAVD